MAEFRANASAEQRNVVDGRWVPGAGTYRSSRVFLKASYLYRF